MRFRMLWSDSEFAHWIRKNDIPDQTFSIRYWLSTELIDAIQDIVYSPVDWADNVKHYIYNRWVHKSHQLSSRHLEPGKFYEFEEKMLFCLMDTFVDYCINELAEMQNFDEKYSSNEEALLAFFNDVHFDPDYDWSPKYRDDIKEMQTIYSWWTNLRPLRELREDVGNDKLVEQYLADEAEDTDMLMRLIKIRNSLWT